MRPANSSCLAWSNSVSGDFVSCISATDIATPPATEPPVVSDLASLLTLVASGTDRRSAAIDGLTCEFAIELASLSRSTARPEARTTGARVRPWVTRVTATTDTVSTSTSGRSAGSAVPGAAEVAIGRESAAASGMTPRVQADEREDDRFEQEHDDVVDGPDL